MKTVIKTLAIAGVSHIIIMNAGSYLSRIARKEKVQNTKFGSLLYVVMKVASSASSAYGVIIDPELSQEDVTEFIEDSLAPLC